MEGSSTPRTSSCWRRASRRCRCHVRTERERPHHGGPDGGPHAHRGGAARALRGVADARPGGSGRGPHPGLRGRPQPGRVHRRVGGRRAGHGGRDEAREPPRAPDGGGAGAQPGRDGGHRRRARGPPRGAVRAPPRPEPCSGWRTSTRPSRSWCRARAPRWTGSWTSRTPSPAAGRCACRWAPPSTASTCARSGTRWSPRSRRWRSPTRPCRWWPTTRAGRWMTPRACARPCSARSPARCASPTAFTRWWRRAAPASSSSDRDACSPGW